MYVKTADSHYLLRPETIESLWYLYQVTGDERYRSWGWEMFQGIERYCRTPVGYTSIGNVRNPSNTAPRDKMESYFLAETLKYFYLLFSDEIIDLKKTVMTTEGHLLPVHDKGF